MECWTPKVIFISADLSDLSESDCDPAQCQCVGCTGCSCVHRRGSHAVISAQSWGPAGVPVVLTPPLPSTPLPLRKQAHHLADWCGFSVIKLSFQFFPLGQAHLLMWCVCVCACVFTQKWTVSGCRCRGCTSASMPASDALGHAPLSAWLSASVSQRLVCVSACSHGLCVYTRENEVCQQWTVLKVEELSAGRKEAM